MKKKEHIVKTVKPGSIAEELEDEADFYLLEERLINYPALAIGQCHRAMNGMAKKLRKNVNRAMNLLNDYQQDKYDDSYTDPDTVIDPFLM